MNLRVKIVLFSSQDGKYVFKPFGYNKFLLGIFGLLLQGWNAAIAGFFIGCILDSAFIRSESRKKQKRTDWRLNFLMLGAFIVQVSGMRVEAAYNQIWTRLNNTLGEGFMQNRMMFFTELLRQRIQVEAICDKLKADATIDDKISLIRFLYDLSSSGKSEFEKVNRTIYYLAARIDLDESHVKTISAQFAANPESVKYSQRPDIYSVFGISTNATYTDLKKSYYRLAKKYHPDSNLHLSEPEKKKYSEEFRKITLAYEKIKYMKGWK